MSGRLHDWQTGHDGWGVVPGVSRCKRCGVLATAAGLEARDCIAVHLCHQFMWWVCAGQERQGPMNYTDAKALLARRPEMWMEIVPA